MSEFLKQIQKLQSNGLLDKLNETLKKNEAFNKNLDSYIGAQAKFELPKITPIHIPNATEVNSYQSAGALVKRLANSIIEWREALPEDQQPAIHAILSNGLAIEVDCLSEETFHAVRIEGRINGAPCMLLVHQASVQLLCYVQKIEKEDDRRKIGFILDGERTDV